MQVKDLQLKRALRTSLFLLLLGAGMKSFAERVEPGVARAVAATFLNNNGVRSNQLTDLSERAGFSNLFIFNGEEGFVILAADDRVKPILGYSLTDQFVVENMPENLRWWLQGYNDEIQYAVDNQIRVSSEVASEWEGLKNGESNRTVMTTIVAPLIQSTWGQGDGYNDRCPYDYNADERTLTGCVATAMAQIMRYWAHPLQGKGYHSYEPDTHPEYGTQQVNFGVATYDWSNMPLDYANSEIAKLMYHCGVSVSMDYGISGSPDNGSSAYDYKVPYALKTYFGYSGEVVNLDKDQYDNDVEWILMMKEELDAGRPMLYGGQSSNDNSIAVGHAFVCDGYDSNYNFHFNWGWDGDCQNSYFSIYALTPDESYNFSFKQDVVLGIQPVVVIGDLKYALSKSTAKVVGHIDGTSASGSLTIPSSVTYTNALGQTRTYEVVAIGNNAFSGCSGFTGSLTIPNSVTSIGYSAFSGCSGFTGHLTIGNSVTSIGEYTFNGCNGFIGDLTIGNSVTSIGNYAFNGCSGFNGSLTIPNSVTSLGQYAFSGCGFNGLEIDMTSIPDQAFNNYHSGGDYSNFTGSLTIGNSVTSIGEDAFYGCSGFTGSLTIPNSVTSIGSSAFSGCSGFTGSLTIGNSVTSIGYSAFSGCSGFTGNLIIPNSVTSISDYAFYGCSGFTGSLAIPNSATSIGKSSFYDCSGFTGSLTIPNSVTSIGVDAFRECSGFTGNLTIPNSVTSLGGHAFYGCGFSGLDINMTNIPDGAFYECSGITGNLTIGNSVTSIGYRAFSGCSGFTGSLTIPNSVTNIESYAFYGCSGFTGGLTIPNSVADLGWSTFEGCSGFTGGLIIPNSVTDLGFRTFEGCSGFTGSLVISNSVTSIREGTFRNCSGFTGDLTIPDAVTYINEEAFAGCSGFTGNLIIPNSVTYIYEGAFKNCSGFTGDLTIPNAITHLNESVFQGCSGLTGDVIIPDGIISIRANAFDGCSGLSGDLSIPHSVTSIGENAFASCSSLTSIHSYGAVPPATCSNAFTNMDFSIPVYVPLCSASDYGETEPWSNFTNYQAALPCPYTFTGNGSDNLWSNPENWHTMPTNDYDIIINANCEMDEDVEASGVIINNTGTLVIKSGHVLTIRENRTRSDEALNGEIVNRGNTTNLIIEDDGQLVYGKGGLLGTVKKDIAPFALNGNDGWHLLSSPVVGSKTIGWIDNMLSNEYDLYYYDEPTHYWKNYKNPENGFNKLEATQGYLYANSGTITPTGSRVGNGKCSSEHVPFYTLYNYSISEILFRASELEAVGLSTSSLGSLCWYATNATGYEQNGINIWMANVNDEGLTETSHNTGNMTMVYSGSMTPVVGWNEFVFNENAFAWDGTSNILICVQRNNGTWNSAVYWQTHVPGFAAKTYQYSDDSAYNMASQTYSMTTSVSDRPNTIFKTVEEVGEVGQIPITLSFLGELENGSATISVPLSYSETAGNLKGFNLVGNPFVHNVTTYASTNVADGCFRLNETKDNLIVSEVSETQPLKPAEGFFVKATDVGASITFNPGRSRGETERKGFINLELMENGKLIDRLIVKQEGEPLEKLTLKENGTRLYAMQNKQEIAVVSCEGSEQPINFKAAKNGNYMITASLDNMAVDYLHLIDNLTGADVDLLVEPTYTFEAKTTDYDSRFKLVFSICGDADGDNDAPFAFINNGNIIVVSAEAGAVLQIVDAMGRVLVCRDASNASAISTIGMAPGVYVLCLINGEEVKTQKIVVE